MRRALLLVVLLLPAAVAHADEEAATQPRPRLVEVGVGGGLRWLSPDPGALDVGIGGQLSLDATLDLGFARAAGLAVMPDPARPDHLHVAANARVLFVMVHDFTWRRTGVNELLRLMAGVGGTVGLPDGIGELDLGVGFAMIHLAGSGATDQPLDESYGAYAGAALRLRLGPVRDELRIAVHGLLRPPGAAPVTGLGDLFGGFAGGVTGSNRLYVEGLVEGPVSLGPELLVAVEQLHDGPVLLATLGLRGTIGVDRD